MDKDTHKKLPICERLRRKERRLPATGGGSIGTDADGKTTVTSYVTDDGRRLVNPDGPEAADTIEALVEALSAIASQAICYGMSADETELRDWLKFISETAETALSRARNEQVTK
jgi:hypothetical protein